MNKSNSSDHCACDFLLDMTAQGELESLNASFLRALVDCFKTEEITLEPARIDDATRASVAADNFELIPVRSNDDKLIAHIKLGSHEPADEHELEQILSVFANQYQHLMRSTTDKLTGLMNRHAFDDQLSKLFESAAKRDKQMVVAVMDIDHFKQVNDTWGHLFGDEVLILFSNIMRDSFRANDYLFRFGGEEFIVVLDDIDLAGAKIVLERFRKNVSEFVMPQVGKITVSVGYTAISHDLESNLLIAQADEAVYFAKHNGRNQCQNYEQLLAEGKVKPSSVSEDIELF